MTIAIDSVLTPCAEDPQFYLDDYLSSPPPRGEMNAMQRRALLAKRAEAHRRCAGCPVLVDCLYRAVVEVDVSGFVACTVESERIRMRRDLGIRVHESAPDLGASRVGVGPVSHDAVLAARAAHPTDTCRQLAERLGCSPSTVKRHLRRAREEATSKTPVRPVTGKPSVDAVLDAFDRLETSQIA
jgi:hypothetical protein